MELSAVSRIRRPRYLTSRVMAVSSYVLGPEITELPIISEKLLWESSVRLVLNCFRGRGATDPRDQVYAALPLVLPFSHPANCPDYTLSVNQVYVQIIGLFLHYEESLNILNERSGSDPSLPSWVPDWRHKLEANVLCTRLDYRNLPLYNADKGRKLQATISMESIPYKSNIIHGDSHSGATPDLNNSLQAKRSVLTVHEILLDTITQISPIYLSPQRLAPASLEGPSAATLGSLHSDN